MIRQRSLSVPDKGLARRRLPMLAMAPFALALRALPMALISAALLTAPVLAATGKAQPKPAKPRFTLETPLVPFQAPGIDDARFAFTASGPAAARAQTVERAFRFTPSGQGDSRRSLSLGVAARVSAPGIDRSRAGAPVEASASAAPTSYNVDLSVAWRGITVNTAFGHAESGINGLAASRDIVGVGIGYSGRNWRTRLQGNAEKGSLLFLAPLERRYSVELGGAYVVAPRFSVTGGLRYKLPLASPSLVEPNGGDQSVYVGTNIAF
jgi:hypothetical protein